jgi:hypothetical protein
MAGYCPGTTVATNAAKACRRRLEHTCPLGKLAARGLDLLGGGIGPTRRFRMIPEFLAVKLP